MLDKIGAIDKMNRLGSRKKPFLFVVDFDLKNALVLEPDEVGDQLLYDVEGVSNYQSKPAARPSLEFARHPSAYDDYLEKFDRVSREIHAGNTYLLNLTCRTMIRTNYSLEDIFQFSQARFRLLLRDRFVVFSPEIFVQIRSGRIFSYPMKGTINASVQDAEKKILEDKKELAEHYTIVDLIRNDLSMVSKQVRVDKFRYVEKLKTHSGELLQVSSVISGELEPDYPERIGDILFRLLPAGSVTGAPKQKTVEIIQEVEGYERGFYTGVFGYFDGTDLNSCVMIRFIEKQGDSLFYKSGGGITSFSDPKAEYNEMTDKVYVPVF